MESTKDVKSTNPYVSFEVTSDGMLAKLRKKSENHQINSHFGAKAMDNEVRYLRKAKDAGVNVPKVHESNSQEMSFKMEYLHDMVTASEYLKSNEGDKQKGNKLITSG